MQWKNIESAPLDGTVVDLWIVGKDVEFRAPDFKFDGTQWIHETAGDPLEKYYLNAPPLKATHWMAIEKP